MSRRTRILGNLASFLLLILPCFATETDWVEVRSPHFSVVTDAGEKQGREVALRFEQMRAVFAKLMDKATVNLPVPLQIVAFRNSKEMQAYVPLWNGKPTQAAGLFEGNDDRSFILIDLSVADPWHVVFHEYAHQLLNGNTGSQFQPWFDEGFAEFFSSIKVNGKEAEIGLPPERDYQVLQREVWLKVPDLFRVQRNSSTYNQSGNDRRVFYAQSWLVVNYLFHKQLIPKLESYFEMTTSQHRPVEDAVQEVFGMSAAGLDAALHGYFKANHFFDDKLAAPPGMDSDTFIAKPIRPLDAQAVLADMHLHSRDFQSEGRSEFEEILKTEPDNVAALRGLGYAYLQQHDYARAEEYFRQAVEREPEDPRILYYSALMIEQQEGPGVGNDDQELKVIQSRLEKAIQLNPEFADAYCRLAFTYVSQNQPEKALETMTKAVALNPRNQAYTLNLAKIYLFNGKIKESIHLLELLQTDVEPRFAAEAAQLLERARAMKQGANSPKTEVAQREPQDELEPGRVVADQKTQNESQAKESPTRFLKGKLISVDCSVKPEAVLTVVSGPTTWKFHARDGTRVITIGAENLSCDWSNRRVAVNYQQTGEATGEIISLELQ